MSPIVYEDYFLYFLSNLNIVRELILHILMPPSLTFWAEVYDVNVDVVKVVWLLQLLLLPLVLVSDILHDDGRVLLVQH
jgi:hypothetical protein